MKSNTLLYIFQSSLVKGKVSGAGIITEALNPVPVLEMEIQPGDMRIKQTKSKIIRGSRPEMRCIYRSDTNGAITILQAPISAATRPWTGRLGPKQILLKFE